METTRAAVRCMFYRLAIRRLKSWANPGLFLFIFVHFNNNFSEIQTRTVRMVVDHHLGPLIYLKYFRRSPPSMSSNMRRLRESSTQIPMSRTMFSCFSLDIAFASFKKSIFDSLSIDSFVIFIATRMTLLSPSFVTL